MTGIGQYTYYLMRGLQNYAAINQLICIPKLSSEVDRLNVKKKYLQTACKNIIRSWSGAYSALDYYRNYSFRKKTRCLLSENFLYHEPCYVLRPYSGPKICNIHDLSHIYYPNYHPEQRVRFLLENLPRSIQDAHHIITSSHYMRDEIMHYFKLAPEKITTVYHGVSNIFKPRQPRDIDLVLQRYGLFGKLYLLSVGTLEPRKNLARLIQAFSYLSERQRKQHPLVLVGTKGWGEFKSKQLINQLHRKGQLICLGYVPDADLPFLYSGAYAFTYLSLYEGFGLPLLEAMASGIPTLASSVASLHEIVNSAGLLVDPFNVDTIKDKLQQLLEDNNLRAKLKRQGFIQASQFSWQGCVENTVKVYQKTLDCFS